MENECACLRRDFNNHALYNTFILHSQFSILHYRMGPEPSSFSLVMDLITTV